MPGFIHQTGRGVSISIKLAPNASSNKIVGVETRDDGSRVLRVRISATPEKGKANNALLSLLANAWEIPKSALSIQSGSKDRNKTILVSGDAVELEKHLRSWMERYE